MPINEVLDYLSGNSGLTEEEIYQKILVSGQRYEVLSSSTIEKTKLGEVPQGLIDKKPMEVFEDKEGILVVRNGKAGTTFFLNKGKYTINDDAYILFLRKGCKYEVSLRWLMIQYKKAFLEYSSSTANGTWNMTGFFKEVKIDIPSLKEQRIVVDVYDKFEGSEQRINLIRNKLEDIY